jgi:hypothetical protein
MRRLLIACIASLACYGLLFGCVLDRPLTYGLIDQQLEAKLARASQFPPPRLVILAGSNGPYSHRCEVIEAMLAMPCVNGGIAVGIGLDYLFTRWRERLRPGDIVYLPMEEEQYARSRSATALGPDASIMFRRDWRTLAELPPERWLAAFFSYDLRQTLMSLIEMTLISTGFHDPRAKASGEMNAWGDHAGHTPQRASAAGAILDSITPHHATANEISVGHGSALIGTFVHWAAAHGIRAIGGPPTQFIDSPMSDATEQAIRSVYLANGGEYLDLPNRAGYPRSAFFDSAAHLSEPWQLRHSAVVAQALAQRLHRPLLHVELSAVQ